MTDHQILNMNLAKLKEFVIEIVNEQLNRKHHSQKDERSVEEVLAAMDRIRWTPPPSSPSTLELLREDRER